MSWESFHRIDKSFIVNYLDYNIHEVSFIIDLFNNNVWSIFDLNDLFFMSRLLVIWEVDRDLVNNLFSCLYFLCKIENILLQISYRFCDNAFWNIV